MDRRTSLQWMFAALALPELTGAAVAAPTKGDKGYGTDPQLTQSHKLGALWPLSFDAAQRRCAAALCALIIPADAHSPSAAELEVHQFIDEWISAPYPRQQKDRTLIVEGLAWIDAEAQRRFAGKAFAELSEAEQKAIADDICWKPKAAPGMEKAAAFFARFRDLTAGGFYTTPQGTQDLGFVGNRPSATFDGPPEAVLKIVGVT
jgi:Gluconate 2-dehydrogenase subunit 3